jgi:16S rRNA (cytidine1402-2'-O)-methyltransferase
MNQGTLFIIATPIGNLEDISARALRILREADLIACEDTRHTSKLLTRYGIDTPRKSYHEYNEEKRTNELLLKLSEGMQIALVSDSGTPLVSDPGYEIVSACRREGVRIVAVPGPNAAISALVGSGLPTDSFLFAGFLPPRSAQRKRRLEELASIPATLIFYEVLGPRRAAVARELTKIHEEFIYGTLPELLDCLESKEKIQGEFAVVVDRGDPAAAPISYPASIKKHLQEELQKTGVSRNTALKSIAQQRGISRKQAYKMVLEEDN